MTIRALSLVVWYTILPVLLSAQTTFTARSLSPSEKLFLQEELFGYELLHLDSRALLRELRRNAPAEITLAFGESRQWTLRLIPENIRSEKYQLQMATESGTQTSSGYGALTLGGQVIAPMPGTCRLTLNDDFIYGVFEIGAETWYIEPARRFGQSPGRDAYLLYRASDVLPNPDGRCAALETVHQKTTTPAALTTEDCIALDIALVADYQMFTQFNDAATLENYVLGVLNNVHANYRNDFIRTIRFKVTVLHISICEFCDAWEPGFEAEPQVNYLDYLRSFRDWANNNGLGAGVAYDVASLWTGRILTDDGGNNIGGGGYFGGMCNNLRYNVLRRYSENASLMRALQAHELGHNFNARHDASGSPTIMAPRIRDVQMWSETSRSVINNFINAAVLNTVGCADNCAEQSLPQATFSVDANSGCAPFTARVFNKSTAANSWTWHFPGGTPASSLEATPTVSYDQPGEYDVQLIVSNPNGQDTLTQTALITVRDKPTAAFTANVTAGSNVVAFVNETIDTDDVIWDFGDGKTSTEINPTHIYEKDGLYEVQLTASNICDTNQAMKMVSIVTPPAANFSASVTTGCAPLQVQFDNLSSPNATDFEWSFSGGNPAASDEPSPLVEFTAPGKYSVQLTARNEAGETVANRTDYITVLAEPVANFNFHTNEKTVTFSNFAVRADDVRWEFGDGAVSQENTPTHTYAEAGIYEALLIASNTCGSDTSRQFVQIGGAAPVADFAADVLRGCAPFTVQFFERAGGNLTARRWYFPGGEPAFSSEQNPLVTYEAAGDYPVALAVENIWGVDSVFLGNYMAARTTPQADFSFQVNDFTVAFLTDTTNADERQYFWNFGDGNTSTEAAPRHTYARSGLYEVTLSVADLCGAAASTASVILEATSVLDNRLVTEIRIAPNPNGGQFQLSLTGTPQPELVIEWTNVLGQILQRQRADFSVGTLTASLDLPGVKPGVYWLRIRSASASVTRPFVVQKP